jgi:sphinganine-1-phosphate aldolase
MEAEVVRIAAELFHGDEETCGTVTSGGTESIILAVKAYRDYAVNVSGIRNPEILAPVTAHAAFEKSAELLGMRIRHVPIDGKTMKVRLDVMERMISKNTCMLVGSTPAYPHGCIDNIEGIGKLGLRYNIPVHVDACLGGFLLAFMPRAGFEVPPFDFAVDGVTSISADTHKYAFAPKGSSVLLFSDKKYKHQQYFVQTNWPGGIYATATLAGSRAGVTVAGCWSSLLHFGLEGYTDTTRKIIQAAKRIEAGLRKISGIYVLGEPQVSVVSFGSDEFDIYRLADSLNKKGWNLNNLQFPSSVHICVTYRHTEDGVVEQFLRDVSDAVRVILLTPQEKVSGAVALYASSQQIPDRSLVGDIIGIYIDSLYKTSKVKGGDENSRRRKNATQVNGAVKIGCKK